MLFGAHVSIAKDLVEAPRRAYEIGCEVFQFFSRSPKGGKAPELSENLVRQFKKNCQKYSLKEYYIHAPYFINLGSKNNRIFYGSIKALRDDLERGSKLSAKFVMTHLGSAKDLGQKRALNQIAKGIGKIFDGYRGKTQFLIEMSAGSGEIIGDSFEELKSIIGKIDLRHRKKIGICFDTAHAFESGYDLRTPDAVKETFNLFDEIIGLKWLKLIHANDSKSDLGSHIDRHEHIGRGRIGLEGFRAIIHKPRLSHLNMIIETPHFGKENWDKTNLNTLKKLRK